MKINRFLLAAVVGMTVCWQASAQWEEIGTGVYYEDLLTYYEDMGVEPGLCWNVKVEESTETPGLYRFIPYHDLSRVAEIFEGADNETYIVLHAEDPDKVWMEDFEPYPFYEMYFFSHMVPEAGWTDVEFKYGTLKDGVITFPAMSIAVLDFLDVNEETGENVWHAGNRNGGFALHLPGGEIVKDYSLNIKSSYCGMDNEVPFTITTGEATALVKYAIYKGTKEVDGTLLNEIAENGTVIGTGEQIIKCPARGMHTVVMVTLDANSMPCEYKTAEFYGMYDDDADWKSLGTTDYFESIVAEYYKYDPVTLTVEIQENVNTPSYFRLVNPYAEYYMIESAAEHSHDHYMYIHAENPEAVWIENSPLGVDLGYGEARVTSDIAKAVDDGFTVEEAIAGGLNVGKVNADREIVFPEYGLWYGDRDYFNGYWYSTGCNFMLKLPEGAGVDNVTSDDAEAPVYYNLQGIKLDGKPSAGTMYIEQRGTKVSKKLSR